MKTLKIWEDWDGKIVFEKSLDEIEVLKIEFESIKIILDDGFSKTFSILDDGFNYSFSIT